jgi:hypothetical protein
LIVAPPLRNPHGLVGEVDSFTDTDTRTNHINWEVALIVAALLISLIPSLEEMRYMGWTSGYIGI